jgi:hypothetical protein
VDGLAYCATLVSYNRERICRIDPVRMPIGFEREIEMVEKKWANANLIFAANF